MTGGASLGGLRVGVTASRKAAELGELLARRGARPVFGPAVRIVPVEEDEQVAAATRGLVTAPPDVTVVTTGIGFRGWLAGAERWGVRVELQEMLGRGEIIARGPKAKGAVRAAGLSEVWSPATESSAEVLTHLLARGVAGARIAIQLHGDPLTEIVSALTDAGADVLGLTVYRWVPPADPGPVDALTDALVSGGLDAVTFTSAPAVAGLLRRADERGLRARVVAAMRSGRVPAVCVGPVTAAPLEELGVATVQPTRSRLGPMVRALEEVTGRPMVA
ncbi:uroporphyrinogen-III synthase [Pseudonocardia xishanensis]|uniref:Tetrapyrrole biosynthesis uroporphyrinogen III synthase domain-containing protein n=1 Tax=Pseudonocardia xishanensis TaxID=630995 RepID=A0ABP8S0W8_9PSEU